MKRYFQKQEGSFHRNAVTPVYFEYCNRLNQRDHASLHASNLVERGEKWVTSKWTRQRRFVSANMHET